MRNELEVRIHGFNFLTETLHEARSSSGKLIEELKFKHLVSKILELERHVKALERAVDYSANKDG